MNRGGNLTWYTGIELCYKVHNPLSHDSDSSWTQCVSQVHKPKWVVWGIHSDSSKHYGSCTLHVIGQGQGPGLGPGMMGFYITPRSLLYTLHRNRETLFSIMPIPVSVQVPWSVYELLDEGKFSPNPLPSETWPLVTQKSHKCNDIEFL